MTQQDDITQRVLTDEECISILKFGSSSIAMVRAIESALLSKLRAPVSSIREGFELTYAADADDPACATDLSHFTNGWRACLMSQVRAPVADSTLPLEQALHELVDKIVPGLDTGDLVHDAGRASAMLSGIMASAPVAGEAPYYAVMHGNALYGIFDTEAAAEACKAQGHPDAPFSVKPLYAVPQASTVAGEAQEPVAYAVHNIDTKGQTRVAAVKPWAGNESMLDDDRWGDRWAGNRPLVYGDAAPQASAEALEVARAALMEIADLADVEADQRGVIVNQALTKIAKMTVAPQASAEVQPNAEIVALAREGVRVNKPGTPEYQICAELRRLARALKQPQAEQGDAREA